MSYYFRMGFKEIERDKVFDYCLNLLNDDLRDYKKIIDESLETTVFDMEISRYQDNKTRRLLCDNFIKNIYERVFLYWPDKNLLGILVNHREDPDTVNITFQNGCDQDYSYDTWKGISYFEEFVEKYRSATVEDLMKIEDFDREDIESDLEYFRRSAVYDHIFEELQLREFVSDKDGDFQCFRMNALKKPIDVIHAYSYLDNSIPKPLKKPNSDWHSMKNTEDNPRPGEIVTLAYITDHNFDGVAEGVYTEDGFKILEKIEYDRFLIITAWKRKGRD